MSPDADVKPFNTIKRCSDGAAEPDHDIFITISSQVKALQKKLHH